jgi:hypothetical protein
MRFEDAYDQYRRARLSREEATQALGSPVSTFYRMRRRYGQEGMEGLPDRRLGKLSARRSPVEAALSAPRGQTNHKYTTDKRGPRRLRWILTPTSPSPVKASTNGPPLPKPQTEESPEG